MALPNPYERLAEQFQAHRQLALRNIQSSPLFGHEQTVERASLFTDLLLRVQKATQMAPTYVQFADLLADLGQVVRNSPYKAGQDEAHELLQMAGDWWDEQVFNQNTFAVHFSQALRTRMDALISDEDKVQVWFYLNLLYHEVMQGDVDRSSNGLISALYDLLETQAHDPLLHNAEAEGQREDFFEARRFFEAEIQNWRGKTARDNATSN